MLFARGHLEEQRHPPVRKAQLQPRRATSRKSYHLQRPLFHRVLGCTTTTSVIMVSAWRSHLNSMPNGPTLNIPLGHANHVNGAARNQYAQDWMAAGRTWTASLCQKDSDGDGMSNGYELGDPCCVWTSGSSSWNGKRTTGLTSPGLANSGSDVTTVHSCPGGGGGGAATTTTPTGAQSTAAPPSGGGMGAASVSASTRSGPVFVLWNLLLFTLVVKISDRLY